MTLDRASLWTSVSGTPRKLADIQACDGIPPRLQALMPPRHSGNIQRRIQQLHFEQNGIELRGRPLAEQDWLALVHFGHAGIGALDVFPSDRVAIDYYANPQQHELADLPALLRFVRGRATVADMDQVLAVPVSGVPGMQPKLLLSDWVVKIDASGFTGLLPLEALAYSIHRQAGCTVPETKLIEVEGEQMLMSRRFDRNEGLPVSLESMYSILASRSPDRVECNTDGSMEDVLGLLRGLTNLPQAEAYRRFVLALLTGNGDMHLQNMSVLGTGEDVAQSPIYDPAPMRAYRGRPSYDLLSALPFSNIGGVQPVTGFREYAESGATPHDLKARLIALGASAGLNKDQSLAELEQCLTATEGYIDEAVAVLLDSVTEGYSGRTPDIPGFEATLRDVRAKLI